MLRLTRSSGRFAVALFALAALTPAQSLFQVHGEVLAADGLPVPGVPGAVFGGSGSFDFPCMDSDGSVLFRARFTGGGAAATDDRAYFFGKSQADLALVIRGGDVAPTLAPLTLNSNASPFTQGLGGSPRLSPGGAMFFSSSISGAGLTTANDSALFVGPPTGFFVAAREGDPAPGTLGATFSSSFSNLSHQPTGLNSGYRVLFQSNLAGGDVSGTTNNTAWFSGIAGSVELVQRKGDVVPTGEVIASLGFVSQMNAAGQIVLDAKLSTTLGSPVATTANDTTLWLYTPGFGTTLLVREGDPAPGTVGATFANSAGSWSVSTGANSFNNAGQFAMNAELLGGDVSAGFNDRGIFIVSAVGTSLLLRRDAPAPGTPANFGVVNSASINLNSNGDVAFQTTLQGGGVTTTDDTAIYAGGFGGFTLVAREGDAAPGTVGAVYGNFSGLSPCHLNDRGQVVFQGPLVGGDVVSGFNDAAVYAYDPVAGVRMLFRKGDAITVAPGDVRTLTSFGSLQFNNGAGAALGFSHAGDYVLRVQAASGGSIILKGNVNPFAVDVPTISTSTGGKQRMLLNAGYALANGSYIVAGSGSGTTPGFFAGSFFVPLNYDVYFQYTLDFPNIAPLVNTLGFFDAAGYATAEFDLPTGFAILAGLSVDHAYAAVDSLGNVRFISEPVRLTFTL